MIGRHLVDALVIELEPVIIVVPIAHAGFDVCIVVSGVECSLMNEDRMQVISIYHLLLLLLTLVIRFIRSLSLDLAAQILFLRKD